MTAAKKFDRSKTENVTPNCAACRFFNPETKVGFDEDGTAGTCRRYPPVFMPRIAKAEQEDASESCGDDYARAVQASRDHISWAFPAIALDLGCWCGEFEPRHQDDEPVVATEEHPPGCSSAAGS